MNGCSKCKGKDLVGYLGLPDQAVWVAEVQLRHYSIHGGCHLMRVWIASIHVLPNTNHQSIDSAIKEICMHTYSQG